MDKKYNRTSDIYILLLIVGLIIVIDTFRLQNFLWLYDGIKFLLALLVTLFGLWGIFVPYAVISENTLKINASVFKIKEFKLDQLTLIEFNDPKDQIDIEGPNKKQSIRLRSVRRKDRATLKSDLRDIKEKTRQQ